MNWPGIGERDGKPYPGCHTPGVVRRKVNVVRNMTMASRLPKAAILGATGRVRIMTPSTISNVPIMAEKVRR